MSDPVAAIAKRFRALGQDGVPKYVVMRNALAEAIAAGAWGPGERIPAEDALAAAAALSLGTVQRALHTLVAEGRLVRRQGSGTFVADVEAPHGAPFQHVRFLDGESGNILPIYSRAIRRRAARGDGPWRRDLAGGSIVCLERIFSINHEFSLYTHLYFDAGRLPLLAAMDIAGLHGVSVKDLLARELRVFVARYSQRLSVRVFPGHVNKALKLKPGTAGAVNELVAYDRKGEAAYFQDFFIPPNPRRLVLAG